MKFTRFLKASSFSLVVVVLIIALLSTISNILISKGFVNLLEREIAIDEYSMHLEIKMLQARRTEKDFILRKDEKYLTKHTGLVEDIIEYADKIIHVCQEGGADYLVFKETADSIKTYAKQYEEHFNELVACNISKGLIHTQGLQGNFRKSAHSLMAAADSLNLRSYLPKIGEDLLQIRRSEKDYLLRLDKKYIDRLRNQVAALKVNINSSSVAGEEKQFIVEIADSYLNDFNALVAENKNVEKSNDKMRESVHKIEPLTEKMSELAGEVQHEKVTKIEGVATIVIILGIITSLVGIIGAVFVGYRLVAVVKSKLGAEPSELEKIASEIARGNTKVDFDSFESFQNIGLYKEMRTMAEEVQKSVSLAEQIANGDISVDAHLASEDDALGMALEKMTTSLNNVVAGIKTASDQLDSSAGQVNDASQVIAESATEQAATIEEITASMVEIEKNAGTNSENAANTNKFALEAKVAAQTGADDMEKLRTTMDEVVESSNQVVKIIKVIDDIAFQTNLLALNAAVEAARAGAHGKGFAVVADEVRNLASRSAKAAQETADLITASNTGATKGAEMTSVTAEAFSSIVEKVGGMAELVSAIANGAQEQENAVKEINSGLEQLGTAIQNNSATSEETAAASEEMSSQAAELNALIDFFKVKESAKSDAFDLPQVDESIRQPESVVSPAVAFHSEPIVSKDNDSAEVVSYEDAPLDY